MKTAETKTRSTANSFIQAKRQPFFSKEGQDGFFSKTNKTADTFFTPSPVQAKLTVGEPNDKYEVEADAMADKVVQRLHNTTPIQQFGYDDNTALQAKCNTCEEEKIQKKEEETTESLGNEPEIKTKPIFESEVQDQAVQAKTENSQASVEISESISKINSSNLLTSIQQKCENCEEEEMQEGDEPKELQYKISTGVSGDAEDDEDPDIQRRASEMEKTEYPILFKKVPGLQMKSGSASTGSRERVVEEAKKMLGKIEASKDDGSGRRVGAEHLLEIFHLAAKDAWSDEVIENVRYKKEFPHWCGIFSVYAIKKAGIDLGFWEVGAGVSRFNTLEPTDNPQPGDIGYFTEKQHHCIIKEVNGDTIVSIDGNSGNFSEVKELTRPRSKFHAFFTPFTGSEKYLQRKEDTSSSGVSDSLSDKLTSRTGKGTALSDDIRPQMESNFGIDFSGVNIHTDSSAVQMNKDLNAQAFTHGNDIYFNEGKYDPNSKSGQHLLAHELTHTVQQGASVQRKNVPEIQKTNDTNNNQQQGITARFIVDDNASPSSEQLTKIAFLNRLNREVCTISDAAFKGTEFSTETCPYITRAFTRLQTYNANKIESILLRYEPRLGNASNIQQYFEILKSRVREAVTAWVHNGDLSGIPEEVRERIPNSLMTAARILRGLQAGLDTVRSGWDTVRTGISDLGSALGGLFFKSKKGGAKVSKSPFEVLQTLGEGNAMGPGIQTKMESAFGTSFSNVKIHTDSTANQLSGEMNARAFTVGNHVAFGTGEYKPNSLVGNALLAHELAHVQQQKGHQVQRKLNGEDHSNESQLEEQADNKAVNAVAKVWTKDDKNIEIPEAKVSEAKTGLKLQRCGHDPGPRWDGDFNDLHIDLYTTTNLNETPVDPGEAITRDFPSFVARLNHHEYQYPRATSYRLLDENNNSAVGTRIPSSSGVSRIPMPPLGQYTLEGNVATGLSDIPFVKLRRSIRIIESYKTLSERQSGDDLENQSGRTVSGELLNYEQFSAIIRQNAVSVAGVSQELVDAWNSAQAQTIIVEGSIGGSISSELDTNAKTALIAFYRQLRTAVSGSDVYHEGTPGRMSNHDYLPPTPAYYTNNYITAARNTTNIRALNGGSGISEWRRYLNTFYDVTKILNKYIADKLEAEGYADSAQQLRVAGAYSNHLRKLYRDHPDAKPVRAVFYPKLQPNLRNEAERGSEPFYRLVALPQKMYTYRTSDGIWHLLDVTRPDRALETEESGGTATVPPRSLMTELDSAERFPEGMMHWQFHGGTADSVEMTHPWSASEILNLIGIVLAVTGMMALVAASGGALAPVVPTVLFVASGLVSAAGSAAHIHESSELGTLTQQSLAADVFGIAAGIFGAAAAGSGHIVKAAQASEVAWTGWRGLSALGAQAIYRPVQIAGIGADFGSLVAFTAQAATQYEAISRMPEGEAKTLAQRRLVAMSLLTGGMTLISIRGGMHDIGAGRTLYLDFTTVNGVRTPVAYRVMPQADILAHARLASVSADAEAFLARTDLDETTLHRFRGELSTALDTPGMSEKEIHTFVTRIRSASDVAEARLILTEFRNSRVSVAVGGVSRNAGYDLTYMHTSPQDFHRLVRRSFTPEGSIIHNGSLARVEGADASNYIMHIDAGGGRVEADVVVVYSDFTAGSTIGTGTVAPGAAGGPARNTVVWNATTRRWTVRVEVDQRLAPKDLPRALGHELDEAGDVINRLHGHQDADINQKIAGLQRSGMFTGGELTSHDIATLREVNRLLGVAVNEPASGASLSIILRDMGLTTDGSQFQARLTRVLSSGHVQGDKLVLLEAWSTYDMAISRNSRLKRFTREQFIEAYENGRRFDEGGNYRWYTMDSGRTARRQFFTDAEIADPDLAFNRIAGSGSRSSFRPYYEMLTANANGIASEAQVRRRFNELLAGPRGRDLDYVRHSLKQHFREDIINYTTNRTRLRRAYSGTSYEEASHQELLRITENLNSADKGSIAEQWYLKVHSTDAVAHVRFTGASGTTRYPDLLEMDGTLQDIKYVRGELSQREIDQFDDYHLMIGQEVTVARTDGTEVEVRVQRLRYSFLHPSGVEANASWMHTKVSNNANISFEVFNKNGQRRIVTQAGIFEPSTNAGAPSLRVADLDFLTDTNQLRLWLNL